MSDVTSNTSDFALAFIPTYDCFTEMNNKRVVVRTLSEWSWVGVRTMDEVSGGVRTLSEEECEDIE